MKTENIEDIEKNIDKNIGFKVPFCMREECADDVKKRYNMEIRGTDIEPENANGKKCVFCGEEAKYYVYVGKTY